MNFSIRYILVFWATMNFVMSSTIRHEYYPREGTDTVSFYKKNDRLSWKESSFQDRGYSFYSLAHQVACQEQMVDSSSSAPVPCLASGDTVSGLVYASHLITSDDPYIFAPYTMVLNTLHVQSPSVTFGTSSTWVIFSGKKLILENTLVPQGQASTCLVITPFNHSIPYIGLKGEINWTSNPVWPFPTSFSVCNARITHIQSRV